MSVDVTGLRDGIGRFAMEIHDEAVQGIMDELRAAAPLGETGETRRQLRAEPTGGPSRPGSRIVAPTPQGEWIEEGTEPHLILPVNARALRFLGHGGRVSTPSPNQRVPTQAGSVVFAMHAYNPGLPARPWFDPVVQTYEERLQQAVLSVSVSV